MGYMASYVIYGVICDIWRHMGYMASYVIYGIIGLCDIDDVIWDIWRHM